MNNRELFKEAWKLAREGAAKYGGKASEYFNESLKIVTKEYNDNKVKDAERCRRFVDGILFEVNDAIQRCSQDWQRIFMPRYYRVENVWKKTNSAGINGLARGGRVVKNGGDVLLKKFRNCTFLSVFDSDQGGPDDIDTYNTRYYRSILIKAVEVFYSISQDLGDALVSMLNIMTPVTPKEI